MQKFVLNSRGIGLVGVMVAVAILGMVAVTLATILDNMMVGQNTVETKSALVTFQEELRNHLSTEGNCLKTFEGLVVTNDKVMSITAFKNTDGTTKYAFNSPYSDFNLKIAAATLTVGTFADAADTTADAVLAVDYNLMGKVLGPSERRRTINLALTRNPSGNALVGCSLKSAVSAGGPASAGTIDWQTSTQPGSQNYNGTTYIPVGGLSAISMSVSAGDLIHVGWRCNSLYIGGYNYVNAFLEASGVQMSSLTPTNGATTINICALTYNAQPSQPTLYRRNASDILHIHSNGTLTVGGRWATSGSGVGSIGGCTMEIGKMASASH